MTLGRIALRVDCRQPVQGRFRLLITGPQGYERAIALAIDDAPAVIADRVREAVSNPIRPRR
jgi:hypothetical protein